MIRHSLELESRISPDDVPGLFVTENGSEMKNVIKEVKVLYEECFRDGVINPSNSDRFWGNIAISPKHLATGITVLLTEASGNTTFENILPQKAARSLARRFIENRLPDFLKGKDKEERFIYCEILSLALSAKEKINHDDVLNESILNAIKHLITNGWDREKQIALAINIYNVMLHLSLWEGDTSSPLEKSIRQTVFNAAEELNTKTESRVFSESTIRSAVALLTTDTPFTINELGGSKTKDPILVGSGHLHKLLQHFNQQDKGYLNALKSVSEALKNSSPAVLRYLIDYLIGSRQFMFANDVMIWMDQSLLPLLKKPLRVLQDGNDQETDALVLEDILSSLIVISEPGSLPTIGSQILNSINGSNNFSLAEKLIAAKLFASSLRSIGIIIDSADWSNETALNFLNSGIKLSTSPQDDAPVMLIATEEVVGYLELEKRRKNPDKTLTENRIGQQAGLDENVIFETPPPAPTPEPEEETPTEEDWLAMAIKEIVVQLMQEKKFDEISTDRETLWQELSFDSPYCIRAASFQDGQNIVRLGSDTVAKANHNTYPRILFQHQERAWRNGIYQSDIAAILEISKDLSFSFVLDRNGYASSEEIDLLLNKDKLSVEDLEILSFAVVKPAHQLLVRAEVFEKRAYRSALERLGGSVKEQGKISDEIVQRQIEESRKYLGTVVETRLPNGQIVRIVDVDMDKINKEVEKTGKTVHTTTPTPKTKLYEFSKRGNEITDEERRIFALIGGYRVLLPYGQEPNASGVAKSEALNHPLVKHVVAEPDAKGLPHAVEFYTNIRLKMSLERWRALNQLDN